ncbi:MAG: hypothetical protein WCZ90_02745 [Melioribacteraceae bacterium]
MNPFIVEQKRIELLNSLPHSFGRTKLWLLFDFYKTLIESNNQILFDAYAEEFLDDFITELNHFSTFYQTPKISESLIELTNKLASNCKLLDKKNELTRLTNDLTFSLKTLKSILDGNNVAVSSRISFPLIEKSKNQQFENSLGILESVKIKISKAKADDSFLIIPSQQKTDELLDKQIKMSFYFALKHLADNYGRVKSHHEVIIYFENRSACYEGNSLGIALTVGFIEELTKFYNLPYLVHIKENITSTGGIENSGNVIPISGNHIQNKVEIIFYSPVEYFILSKADEPKAREKLLALKENYPNRNLNLIPVENIGELLDRRSLIEIKKQPIVYRAAKSVKQNWIASTLFLLLLIILIFVFIKDWDDNPAALTQNGSLFSVLNKSGKILWTRELKNAPINLDHSKMLYRLIDINDDGENEILLCAEVMKSLNGKNEIGKIECLDKNGEEMWCYSFKDSVRTAIEKFGNYYHLGIIDTLKEEGGANLYLLANLDTYYPSAVFKLELKTGKRLDGTLWNSGTMYAGMIKRFTNQTNMLYITCANNAFERAVIFSIPTDKLFGTSPTTANYLFTGKKIAPFANYILLHKSDFTEYSQERIARPSDGGLRDLADNVLQFTIREGKNGGFSIYEFNYGLTACEIKIESDFRVKRDSLVKKGLLSYPLTDTPEYCNLLKQQIRFWDGKQFKEIYKSNVGR